MKVSLFSALLLVHKHGHLFIAMFVSESTIYIYTYTYIPILYVFFLPYFPSFLPPSSYHPPIHLSIHPPSQPACQPFFTSLKEERNALLSYYWINTKDSILRCPCCSLGYWQLLLLGSVWQVVPLLNLPQTGFLQCEHVQLNLDMIFAFVTCHGEADTVWKNTHHSQISFCLDSCLWCFLFNNQELLMVYCEFWVNSDWMYAEKQLMWARKSRALGLEVSVSLGCISLFSSVEQCWLSLDSGPKSSLLINYLVCSGSQDGVCGLWDVVLQWAF